MKKLSRENNVLPSMAKNILKMPEKVQHITAAKTLCRSTGLAFGTFATRVRSANVV